MGGDNDSSWSSNWSEPDWTEKQTGLRHQEEAREEAKRAANEKLRDGIEFTRWQSRGAGLPTSSNHSAKGTASGIFGKLLGCALLIVGIIVAIYIFGWAIATFVVK